MATSSPPSMDGMSPVYELKIRQQPKNARVAIGKEKDRKPIDPPPIIQLDIHPMRHQIHNPYLILVCKLVAPGSTENDDANHQQPEPKDNDLTGSLCSSPYVLKDTNNAQGLFFIFQDVSVRREGTYRLEFNLFELKPLTRECIALARTTSDKFVVFPHRYFPGMAESTFLTRSFSDQGVRIRLRKDSRSVSTRKRGVGALGVGAGSGGVVGRLRTGSTIGLGGQQYSPITISHHSQSHGSGGSHDELSPTSTSPIHRINTTLAGHHHHDLIPGIGHLDRGQHHRGSLASQTSSSLLDSPSNTMLTSPTGTGVGGFGASTATTMGGSGNYSFTGVAAAQQYSYPGTALSLTTGTTADDRYYDYNRVGKRPRLLHGTGMDGPLDHSYGRDPYGRDPYDHHHRVVHSVTLPPHTQGYATMDAAQGYGHGRHHDYYGATAAGAYFGSGM